MTKRDENPTTDMSRFGYRELGMAGKLLSGYAANPSTVELGDGVQVWFNVNSGNVFLCDEDFNVAMMNGDKLENFYSCPNCGREGFADEIGWQPEIGRCDAASCDH